MKSAEKSSALQNRLIDLVINTVKLTKLLAKNYENEIFIRQLIRCASSIGANYTEAIFSYSRADFTHNINICKKETGETIYWLVLLLKVNPKFDPEIETLKYEVESLLKMFISIVKTTQKNNKL